MLEATQGVLYHNTGARCYEGMIGETHIVVKQEEWDRAMIMRECAIKSEQGCSARTAYNVAYFALISANAWHDNEHTCEQATWVCQRHNHFLLHQEAHDKQASAEGENRARLAGVFTVDMTFGEAAQEEETFEIEDQDQALERMSNYFYTLYQHAEDGSPKEARYAALYNSIMRTLYQRDGLDEEQSRQIQQLTTQRINEQLLGRIASVIGGLTEELAGLRSDINLYIAAKEPRPAAKQEEEQAV